ncbi:hypothetical protein D3C78_1748040 [compost metagenome]
MQVGQFDQFDDGNQNAHEVDLEHPPLPQVMVKAVEHHPHAEGAAGADAQQHRQLAEQLDQGDHHAAQEHQ